MSVHRKHNLEMEINPEASHVDKMRRQDTSLESGLKNIDRVEIQVKDMVSDDCQSPDNSSQKIHRTPKTREAVTVQTTVR